MSSLRITPVADIAATDLPWRRPATLIVVEGGSGVLRQQLQRVSEHDFERTLMLGEVPLVHAHLDDYGCPTCLKLLARGMDRYHVEPSLVDKLRDASKVPNAPIASGLDNLTPLLDLLVDGVYLFSWVPHYPTNGQRESFWALSQRLRSLDATIGWANHYWLYGDEMPSFLLPTQSFEACNWQRVEEYRTQVRNGAVLGGIAYESEGFLSALLDGHHRATAALLEGTTIDCLTIMEPCLRGMTSEQHLQVYDRRIELESLPSAAVCLLEQRDERWKRAKLGAQTRETERAFQYPDTPHWKALRKAANKMPDVSDVTAGLLVERHNYQGLDLTDERIAYLLARYDERIDFFVFAQGLFVRRDPRALKLALRLGREEPDDSQVPVFRYLATQRTPEVEAFFIEYCVNDEGKYPELTDIVNDYLQELHAVD